MKNQIIFKRVASLLVFCFLLITVFILFDATVFAGEDEVMIVPNSKSMNDKLNEDDDDDDNYLSSKNKIPADLFEEVTEEDTYTYNVDLTNLNLYNLVSLQDADIRCHVRGSIWIGGTLTGSQYVDDGSLDGVSPSNSYVYTNQSSIYFKSRTNQQSQDAYYLLSAQSVIDTTEYWRSILNALPKDSETIKYISPDENGYVDLKYWDYQASGGDNAVTNIPVLYWTDATKVDMGGLAGHLIAPYADIHITYCNHCGSIVGKSITTDGESHLNYWTPVIETETETETETEAETETESESESETELITEKQTERQTEKVTEKQTEKLTEKQTEPKPPAIPPKQTEKQSETSRNGGVLGESRDREDQSEKEETYELESNKKKKKSGVNGAVRETESPGLFRSIGSLFVPKTGDESPLIRLFVVFSISIVVILILMYAIKNRKY